MCCHGSVGRAVLLHTLPCLSPSCPPFPSGAGAPAAIREPVALEAQVQEVERRPRARDRALRMERELGRRPQRGEHVVDEVSVRKDELRREPVLPSNHIEICIIYVCICMYMYMYIMVRLRMFVWAEVRLCSKAENMRG